MLSVERRSLFRDLQVNDVALLGQCKTSLSVAGHAFLQTRGPEEVGRQKAAQADFTLLCAYNHGDGNRGTYRETSHLALRTTNRLSDLIIGTVHCISRAAGQVLRAVEVQAKAGRCATNPAVKRLQIRHQCKIEIRVRNHALSHRIDLVAHNIDRRREGASNGVGGACGDGYRRTERDECKL